MTFEIIREREGFMALKLDWDRLVAEIGEVDFYLTFDWFYAMVCLTQNPPDDLFVVTVRSEEELIGIIPCRIAVRRLRLFSFRCLEIIGNIYTPYRNAIVRRGKESDVAEAFAGLILTDSSKDWDLINFENLSMRDRFVTGLRAALADKNVCAHLTEQFENIVTDLSPFDCAEEYFRSLSRNRRKLIRKGVNKMNREGSFDVVLISSARDDVGTSMAHYYDVYSKSWKVSEGDPEFHLKLAHRLAAKGILRLFILYFRPRREDDGKDFPHPVPSYDSPTQAGRSIPGGYTPVAARYFVVCGKNAYSLKSAYRQDYARYSLGAVLFWYAAKYLLDIDGVRVIDRQKGGEEYKLNWGKLNEVRFQYRAANPKSLPARLELWNEIHCIPKLRKIKRTFKRLLRKGGEGKQ